MNREAIIERLWNTPALYGMRRRKVEYVLHNAGFFDLLEAAMELAEESTQNVRCSWDKLDAAIAKITGATP
jgi:hypothetical protein